VASPCLNRAAPATAGRLITLQQLFNRVAIARVRLPKILPARVNRKNFALCERLHTRLTQPEVKVSACGHPP